MSILKSVLCIFLTSFAVHYGWRMRGTVIGGEKGAMVPGLFAGLIPALFAGGAISKYFFIPAAACLIGMTYGGIEPYGDSITFLGENQYGVTPNPRKGYLGLMLKGALWFSIAGGYIGMSISSMGGLYSVIDILSFFVLVNVFQFLGYRIFNQPYDKEKKIFPKIYLSFESRDEWGSNIGVLAAILIMAGIHKDLIAIVISVFGLLFGAIGWFVAMKVYYYTEHPFKNGKYFYGKLAENHIVGGWGNMEYTLGSFGGFGIALGFVLSFNNIEKINNKISINGIFNPLKEYDTYVIMGMIAIFASLLIINGLEHYWDNKDRNYSSFIMDCVERVFFNNIPFVFILLCSVPAAKLMTAFMVLYALFLKNSFDRITKEQHRTAFVTVGSLICIAVFVLTLYFDNLNPVLVLASGGIPYLFTELYWVGTNEKRGGWKNFFSFNSSFLYNSLMFVQSTLVVVFGYLVTKL